MWGTQREGLAQHELDGAVSANPFDVFSPFLGKKRRRAPGSYLHTPESRGAALRSSGEGAEPSGPAEIKVAVIKFVLPWKGVRYVLGNCIFFCCIFE